MFKIWKFRKWCLPLAVVGIALAGRSAAQAATVSWNNPAGGDFDEPKNWSTGAVPGNADVVAITLPGTYDVKLTFGHTVAGLVVGGTNARPTLNLNGALTVSNAATINPTGTVALTFAGTLTAKTTTVAGTLNWAAGRLKGIYNVTTTGQLNANGASQRTLVGTINNSGKFNWISPGPSSSIGKDEIPFSTLNNRGIFTVAAGAKGTDTLSNIQINNTSTGTLSVQSGTLQINGDNDKSQGINNGTINVATGAILAKAGGTYTLSGGTHVTGGGTLRLNGGKLIVASPVTVPGIVELDPLAETDGGAALNIASGGKFNWTGGVINSTGPLNILKGAQFNMSTSFGKTLNTTINNSGIFNWKDFQEISASTGRKAVINNLVGGVFNTEPVNETLADVDFNNAGTLNLGGSGKAGRLGLSTLFTQSATGVLNVNIGGDFVGFGAISLAGYPNSVVRLAGTLNVTFVGGFTPKPTDSVKVVWYRNYSGAFSKVNIIGGRAMRPVYTAHDGVSLRLIGLRPAYKITASKTTAQAVADSVQLDFSDVLDAASASDPAHYSVEVNGRSVAVQSAGYNAVTHSVTLGLNPGALQAGDEVVVRWNDVRDEQNNIVAGQQSNIAK